MSSTKLSTFTPAQKLRRIHAAFLVYERLSTNTELWYRRYASSGNLASWGRHAFLKKRADRARQYILRLTAPETEAERQERHARQWAELKPVLGMMGALDYPLPTPIPASFDDIIPVQHLGDEESPKGDE